MYRDRKEIFREIRDLFSNMVPEGFSRTASVVSKTIYPFIRMGNGKICDRRY